MWIKTATFFCNFYSFQEITCWKTVLLLIDPAMIMKALDSRWRHVYQHSWCRHTVRNTIVYLRLENVVLSRTCGPNNLNLNVVDYAIWRPTGASLPWQEVWLHCSIEAGYHAEWHVLLWRFTDHSIGEWRRRLQYIVDQNGKHIEHTFHCL